MTIDRPEQWAIDRLHEERGLWALDTARGWWTKVYSNVDFARRPEDFIFCGFVEAARIYAGGLVPVEKDADPGDKSLGPRVDTTAGVVERRVS